MMNKLRKSLFGKKKDTSTVSSPFSLKHDIDVRIFGHNPQCVRHMQSLLDTQRKRMGNSAVLVRIYAGKGTKPSELETLNSNFTIFCLDIKDCTNITKEEIKSLQLSSAAIVLLSKSDAPIIKNNDKITVSTRNCGTLFGKLPLETITLIFGMVDLPQLASVARTCKTLHLISQTEQVFKVLSQRMISPQECELTEKYGSYKYAVAMNTLQRVAGAHISCINCDSADDSQWDSLFSMISASDREIWECHACGRG